MIYTKRMIKIIFFFGILLIMLNNVFSILWISEESITYFYNEPKDTLDVIYLGSSNAYKHFNTTLAYNLYGFTTGMLSNDSEPFAAIKYLINDAEKYQDAKLYIIDMTMATRSLNTVMPEHIRKTVDNMEFSMNRINAINEILGYKGIDKKQYINYYFSFFMYHGMWKNISKRTFVGRNDLYKGFVLNPYNNTKTEAQEEQTWNGNAYTELPQEHKEILTSLFNTIQDKKINAIFIIPPRYFTDEEQGELNEMTKLIEENGYTIINMNTVEDYNIDYQNDFYDNKHLNINGATKYTIYISKYLKKHYDLPNHKGQPEYASWDYEFNRFKNAYEDIVGEKYDKVLMKYNQ